MSTTLANCRIELSKQLSDYWASTTTTAGNAGGTTYLDTALMAKSNDWISDAPQEIYDLITSVTAGSNLDNERKLSSLDNTSGTITCLAHTGQVLTATGYEIHRLFSPSEKKRALIHAAKHGFPYIFKEIRDTSKTTGNWLINGDVETWTSTSYPDYWRVSSVTATQTSTAKLFKRGSYSCCLSGTAGYLYQDWTYNDDLKALRGKSVTFSAQGWSSATTSLRLAIYDGTTTTYSDYHTGSSKWTDDANPLTVSAFISATATDVTFRVYYASGTAYVDDLRVTGPTREKIYIGDLDLALDYPHSIEEQHDSYLEYEPWLRLTNYEVDSTNGYLYLHDPDPDYRLRIKGLGYLGFSSTNWDATINIDSPQTEILIAEAIMYLYTQMITPNYTSGDRDTFAQMLQYWEAELGNRQRKFGMKPPRANISKGITQGMI